MTQPGSGIGSWRRALKGGPGDAPKWGSPKPHTIASTVTLSTKSSRLTRDGGPSGNAYAGFSLPFSNLDLSQYLPAKAITLLAAAARSCLAGANVLAAHDIYSMADRPQVS